MDKVSNPKGRNNNVAGNSLILSTNTNKSAINIDDQIIGTCTRESAREGFIPKDLAACPILGEKRPIALSIDPNAKAKNLTLYANITAEADPVTANTIRITIN